jgi:hypothetical protein
LACSAPNSVLRPLDRQALGDVDVLAAAVVALAGQALGVLVRQHAALGLEDRLRDEVLARDHLQRLLLATELGVEHRGDLRVHLGEWTAEEVLGHVREPTARGGRVGACA